MILKTTHIHIAANFKNGLKATIIKRIIKKTVLVPKAVLIYSCFLYYDVCVCARALHISTIPALYLMGAVKKEGRSLMSWLCGHAPAAQVASNALIPGFLEMLLVNVSPAKHRAFGESYGVQPRPSPPLFDDRTITY